jgi:hypothetical protein
MKDRSTGTTATRAGTALVAALTVAAATTGCGTGTERSSEGEGACAAPTVTVEPATASPGDEIEITGEAFQHGCEDHPGAEAATPMTDLTVRWLSDGVTAELAVVDADEEGRWSVTTTVPADAVGDARIDVPPSTGATVTLTP